MKHLTPIKALVFLFCLIPVAIIVFDIFTENLSADPIAEILHRTGIWSLRFLLITLAMTPLRQLSGHIIFLRLRRMFGLFTFFYASLHLLVYTGLDLGFEFSHLFEDIIERPYITVGFTAWVLLIPMAITSNRKMIKKLGKNWKKLHMAIYVVTILACLHFIWLVKSDLKDPLIYTGIGLTLLFFRLIKYSYGKPRTKNKTS
ncbi:MAG: sulfoxide reductase heme-binding subunit YedZ [Proteobacteria bacterium]|nr:sulfoxide reductase heme-binding subunit YedZ [Pseudomonadota bacterium]